MLLSKCQHKPVGKISTFESEQHVQIFCASLFAVTAMQKERPADFLVVLAPAVKVQRGGKEGAGRTFLLFEYEGVDDVMRFLKILSQLLEGMP